MKDHEIRGVVNELTEVANRYANHQCLRVCLANVIVPILKGRLPRPQTNREAFESFIREKYTSSRTAAEMFTQVDGMYTATVYLKPPSSILDMCRLQTLWEVWNHGSK